MTASIEQQLEAVHAATTSAVETLLNAVGTGDAVAAWQALQAIEAERGRLENEYEAAQLRLRFDAEQSYYEARWEGMQ